MRSLIVLCMLLAACGGTTTSIDGSDAQSDATAFDAASCTSSGLAPCGGVCVNTGNDPLNCGGCGTKCTGASPMCLGGACQAPTCAPACNTGEHCCQIDGPGPSGPPQCETGDTCPVGCPLCK